MNDLVKLDKTFIITLAKLKIWDACEESIKYFKNKCPDGKISYKEAVKILVNDKKYTFLKFLNKKILDDCCHNIKLLKEFNSINIYIINTIVNTLENNYYSGLYLDGVNKRKYDNCNINISLPSSSTYNNKNINSNRKNSRIITTGNEALVTTKGEGSQVITGGIKSKVVVSGEESIVTSYGEYTKVKITGDKSQGTINGDNTEIKSTSSFSKFVTIGNDTKVINDGESNVIVTIGNNSNIVNDGNYCTIISKCYNPNVINTGKKTGIIFLDDSCKFTLGDKGYAIVHWFDRNAKRKRFTVVYEGEKNIIAGVVYKINDNGEIIKANGGYYAF